MQINSCFARYQAHHRWLAFYDLDEFVVLPEPRMTWKRFLESIGDESWLAVKTISTWAQLNVTAAGSAFPNFHLFQLLMAPLLSESNEGGRSKYVINTRIARGAGIRFTNVHGVYSQETTKMKFCVPGIQSCSEVPNYASVYMIPQNILSHKHVNNLKGQEREKLRDPIVYSKEVSNHITTLLPAFCDCNNKTKMKQPSQLCSLCYSILGKMLP